MLTFLHRPGWADLRGVPSGPRCTRTILRFPVEFRRGTRTPHFLVANRNTAMHNSRPFHTALA
jgi:hypothetical protein